MGMKTFFTAVGAFAALSATADAHRPMTWGGREEHLAVVNPAVAAEEERGNVKSLSGEWEFLAKPMRRAPFRNGIWEHYFTMKWPDARTIKVPGCWEEQGVGEPGESECWDAVWDHSRKPIRHKYMGDGWYRRQVKIPAEWTGKRIWLKIGGVKSKGWFCVNAKQVALVDNYCGTYKYEITDIVKPGEVATVAAQVNNVLPSRKGLMSGMHKWGGIYRDIELEATPQTFIDDAWVRGLFDERAAEVHVGIGRADCAQSAARRRVRVTIDGKVMEEDVAPSGDSVIRVPLADFRPWSPEHPNLYTARVDMVENGSVVHTRLERFGVRKFEVRGKEFLLNGKPFYVRGFGDDSVYPMSGMPPPNRDFHRAHLAKAKAAGFNYVRLHTHCELPEYFEAADEIGIMIQPELPYYSDVPTEGFEFDPGRDVTELWRNYRRYPSFAVYSMGNEGTFGETLDAAIHAYVKAMDQDRLKINQDCQVAKINPPEAADYLGGPTRPWPRGSVDPDRPFVTHEYLNLCIKCDSRDEAKYTGIWQPPGTRKRRAEWLAKFGLDHTWGDRLQDAQNTLQRHYQKCGVESARIDPYCDGYIFWTIVDVVVNQGPAYTAQGLFTPFWETKRLGWTPEGFAHFNSPSCVLLDVPDNRRIFVSGEAIPADFFFANYGDAPLNGARLEWRLEAKSAGRAVRLASGYCDAGDVPLGPVRKVASASIAIPDVDRPMKATLAVSMGGSSNTWDFWVFPRRARRDGSGIAVAQKFRAALEKRYDGLLAEADAARAKVVVAEYGSALADEALARGQRIIAIAGTGGKPNVSLGWWWMGRQVGTAIADHPALAALPHEGVLSPLFFRIVLDTGKVLPYAGLDQEDMLVVGEGGKECYLYLAQGNAGSGKVLMAFGLDVLADVPEAAVLFDGLADYAASDGFNPKSRIKIDDPLRLRGGRDI